MSIHFITLPGRAATRSGTLAPWRSVFRAWLDNHRARRRLRHCLALDPRFARDIGLTPDEIAAECRAPFWAALPSATRNMMEKARW